MKRSLWTSAALIIATACGAIVLPGSGYFGWQTSAEEVAQTEQNSETVSGKVAKLLRNDRDDVDGLKLENGRDVHFPPHIGREVERAVKPGTTVIVVGKLETRPKGEKVFAALRIEAAGQTIKVTRPEPPAPKDGPKANKQAEEKMSVTGKIEKVVKNPHGDVDGLLLSDKTEVKFPPHQGAELAKLIAVGDEVNISGRKHQTPKGETHLQADKITAVASGKVIEREEPAPHRPPAPPHGPKGGPMHDGPKGGPKHDGLKHAKPAPHEQPPHEEILRELRELRKLIERKFPDQPTSAADAAK
ncbi:hypothetical protein ETAA8_25710 [Anatilimnocola aggregata]|uniref:Uncharacterized protein n=1 Tax=Anatilimnocola aggregata TaxID=2528021 RepID=A0A517YB49_9BACT|nr:OB-fold nucleic acid binding domain-containing protein [Anatilimnocola aggregata]QDU27483.1 hypothetical protein ETAA8_25710 [Anatilimnocola aggregata]